MTCSHTSCILKRCDIYIFLWERGRKGCIIHIAKFLYNMESFSQTKSLSYLYFCAVCQINTVEDTTCTSADGCTCKPGYAAPDCCKCDTENDFFNDTDGVCKS